MSTNKRGRSRSRGQGRHVRVFSDLNHDLRPEQLAKIITAAGLEHARLEAESKAQHETVGPSAEEADDA